MQRWVGKDTTRLLCVLSSNQIPRYKLFKNLYCTIRGRIDEMRAEYEQEGIANVSVRGTHVYKTRRSNLAIESEGNGESE